MKKLLLSLSLLLVCVAGNAQKNPVLTIEGGQVQGVLADDHPEVFVYRGIPYAAPPIRENRWKAPQPVVPWKGVKICDTFGRPSYQAIQYTGGYYTEWGYGKEETAVVGDRIYTDVKSGLNAGITGILVMSGETTPEILAASTDKPHLVLKDAGEILAALRA